MLVIFGLAAVLTVYLFGPLWLPGNGALYDAIEAGDEREVRRLIEAGADPNSRARPFLDGSRSERYTSPPLAYALWRNQPRTALPLIAAGADPNARHAKGETPLMIAATAGHADVVEALIAKGADVNATVGGATALRHGAYHGGSPKALDPRIDALLRRAGAR